MCPLSGQPEHLTTLVAETPFQFSVSPVRIEEIPEELRFFKEGTAWRFVISLGGRKMRGYSFGGTAAPTVEDLIGNLFLTCYSTREVDRITDKRGGYGRALRRVLGRERLERFLAADWDV